MAERKSVVIDAVRSPIGVKRGIMAGNIRSDDLAAQVLSQLMDRNEGVSRNAVEDVVMGCAFPEGSQGMLIARSAAVLAGITIDSGAKVVNRFCGSSMDAVHQISQAIEAGDIDVGIGAGVEDMFSVPMGGFNPDFHPDLAEKDFYIGMGETAELLAEDIGISREVDLVQVPTRQVNPHAEVFLAGDVFHAQHARHTRLKDQYLPSVQFQQDTLAEAIDRGHHRAGNPTAHLPDRGSHLDRLERESKKVNIADRGTQAGQNSTPHRFYFWKFWHHGFPFSRTGFGSIMPHRQGPINCPGTFPVPSPPTLSLDRPGRSAENRISGHVNYFTPHCRQCRATNHFTRIPMIRGVSASSEVAMSPRR